MTSVSYQLVFQFQSESMDDLHALIELEEQLISLLEASADVDGHDIGNGEANIFVITPDPLATYAQCRDVVEESCAALGGSFKAAYRPLDDNEYKPIHPKGLERFQVL